MDFRFVALPAEDFRRFSDLDDAQLSGLGVKRMVVDETPGYPCRVSLADAEVGETVFLFSFVHHDVESPYRSAGPIFVRADAVTAVPAVNEIPPMFRHRLLSVRAYDTAAMLVTADVVGGETPEDTIHRLFADPAVSYIHIHNAAPGCFDCRVVRA
jgi:hypothetical protein